MISVITAVSVLGVWGSAAWIYWDATDKKIGKIPGEKGFFNRSAGGWGVLTVLLWIVGFPFYLSKRDALIERAKTQPVEVKRRWLKLSIFCLLGALGVYGSFADPTTDERMARRSVPEARPQNVPAAQAPALKPAPAPAAGAAPAAQPAPATVASSAKPADKPNVAPAVPAPVTPAPVADAPKPEPVAAPPAAANAAELEAKASARAKAREEIAAQRRAAMEREQEAKRHLGAAQSACVYKPVMTDEDMAKCR